MGSQRVLILASTHKDSESTQRLLEGSGLEPAVCSDFNNLLQMLNEGAGALLLAKEVLVSP
ncbi:MAG: hypothetical protein V4736_05230, partial [Bdellovibrionota bacterium]